MNDLRNKEEKLVESLKNPSENHSDIISKMINDTIGSKNKVYLMTDWHLWIRKEKGSSECHERKDFKRIIENIKKIQQDDLLIYMGDLVDGEFTDKEKLKNVILPMNFKKILVLGNNDLFSPSFYLKSCGFDYVVRSFVWKDIIFSHMPMKDHGQKMNICGHLHGYTSLWVPYENHVEVGWCGGRIAPVELMKVVTTQPKYAKHVKECPEHFNEGYVGVNTSSDDSDMSFFLNKVKSHWEYVYTDPYHDDE